MTPTAAETLQREREALGFALSFARKISAGRPPVDVESIAVSACAAALASYDPTRAAWSTWLCAKIRGYLMHAWRDSVPASGGRRREIYAGRLTAEVWEQPSASLDVDTHGGDGRVLLLGETLPQLEPGYERVELVDLLSRLPEPQRIVVTRVYLHGDTAREVAVDLGVSEQRISQLRAKALCSLRAMLED